MHSYITKLEPIIAIIKHNSVIWPWRWRPFINQCHIQFGLLEVIVQRNVVSKYEENPLMLKFLDTNDKKVTIVATAWLVFLE